MSAARPHCRVCVSAQLNWIDGKIREGSSDLVIKEGIEQRAKKHPTGVLVFSEDQIKEHRTVCLGIVRPSRRHGSRQVPDEESGGAAIAGGAGQGGEDRGAGGPAYVLPDDVDVGGVRGFRAPEQIPPLTDEQLKDPVARANMIAKALYHPSKLNEMSAKDLLLLHQNEVRLAEAAAKIAGQDLEGDGPSEESDLDDAVAQAAGHRPDLRLLRGEKKKGA